MFFAWLKKFTPRGLYGRAALILLVPVVVLQLTVLVAYSQRYFNDVTQQLMQGVIAETGLYLVAVEQMSGAPRLEVLRDLDARLNMESHVGEDLPAIAPERAWSDFSGRVVERELRMSFAGFEAVAFNEEEGRFSFSIMTETGRLVLDVPRGRATARNPHQVLVVTAFIGVVISLISIVFLRNQLRPIRRLARAADAFGKGHHVNYRLAGATEVRSAGAAFLNMRNRIERQIEQRTLMLSGVSHDLRTPLTRMRLAMSILEVEAGQEADIAAITDDFDEMERMLDEFLAYARADAGEEAQEIDIATMLRDAQGKIERAGGELALVGVPDDPVIMHARVVALGRAIDNLTGNALRYGAVARLSMHCFDRSVVISVEDDGPGISEADRDRAIAPFVRLDASRNQNQGAGVGLGLSIAADIARKHGGSLRLGESEDLGGLRVDLVLPR